MQGAALLNAQATGLIGATRAQPAVPRFSGLRAQKVQQQKTLRAPTNVAQRSVVVAAATGTNGAAPAPTERAAYPLNVVFVSAEVRGGFPTSVASSMWALPHMGAAAHGSRRQTRTPFLASLACRWPPGARPAVWATW